MDGMLLLITGTTAWTLERAFHKPDPRLPVAQGDVERVLRIREKTHPKETERQD